MAKLSNINNLFSVDSTGEIKFNDNAGIAGYVLVSAGTGGPPVWTDRDTGNVTGSGTENKVVRWTATGSTVGDGPITFATNDSTFAGNLTIDQGDGTGGVAAGISRIHTGTADATDNGGITISSAGATSIGRGAYMYLQGNENDGDARIYTGDAANAELFLTASGASGSAIRMQTAGSDTLTLNHDKSGVFAGNVGIGIATPQTTLQVNGAASALNAHFGQGTNNSSGVYGGISLGYSEAANASYRKVGIVAKAIGDGAARQELHFLVNSNADSNSASIADTKMMINTTGNVGIGTQAPNQVGYGASSKVLTLKADTSGGESVLELIGLGNADNDQVGVLNFMSQAETTPLASIKGLRHTSDPSGKLTFETSAIERMRIQANGRVSIGSDTTIASANNLTLTNASAAEIDINCTGGHSYRLESNSSDNFAITDKTAGGERMRITSGGQLNLLNPTATDSKHFGITNAAGTTGWTFGNGVTANAHQFVIYDNTAGAERMRIASNGVVTFTSGTAIGVEFKTTDSSYGAMNVYKDHTGTTRGAVGYNASAIYLGGEANTNTILQAGGQVGLYINNSTQNVGIGTTTPATKLTVKGATQFGGNSTNTPPLTTEHSAYGTTQNLYSITLGNEGSVWSPGIAVINFAASRSGLQKHYAGQIIVRLTYYNQSGVAGQGGWAAPSAVAAVVAYSGQAETYIRVYVNGTGTGNPQTIQIGVRDIDDTTTYFVSDIRVTVRSGVNSITS